MRHGSSILGPDEADDLDGFWNSLETLKSEVFPSDSGEICESLGAENIGVE